MLLRGLLTFFFLEVEMLQLAALTFKTVVVVIVMSCQYFTGTSEMSPFSLVVAFCFKGRHFVALKFPILHRYLGSLLLTTEVLGTALGEQRGEHVRVQGALLPMQLLVLPRAVLLGAALPLLLHTHHSAPGNHN